MPPVVQHQEGSYRRGLVLGFTIAEVMMLVLFTLLLALAYIFELQRDQIKDLNDRLALYASTPSVDQDVIRLAESVERYRLANAPEQDPQEYFTELTTNIRRAAKVTRDLAQTQEKLVEANKAIARLQSEETTAKSVLAELKAAGIASPTSSKELGQLQQIMAFGSAAYEQAIKASGQNGTIDQRIIELMNQHIMAVGTGGEHPSCWVNAETRKVEPLFNISILDSGYLIDEHFLPDRIEDRKALPLSNVPYGAMISAAQFIDSVRPVYTWSTRQKPECRFHVEIYDRTSETAKNAYKLGDQTIEGFFYPIKQRVR